MNYIDNNDTVLYGCIRVALELQPSEENATLVKGVRQIGIGQLTFSVASALASFCDRASISDKTSESTGTGESPYWANSKT